MPGRVNPYSHLHWLCFPPSVRLVGVESVGQTRGKHGLVTIYLSPTRFAGAPSSEGAKLLEAGLRRIKYRQPSIAIWCLDSTCGWACIFGTWMHSVPFR